MTHRRIHAIKSLASIILVVFGFCEISYASVDELKTPKSESEYKFSTTYGFGFSVVPYAIIPYGELGVKTSKISLRGELYFLFSLGRASVELAWNNILNSKFSVFVNGGASYLLVVDNAQSWTVGAGFEMQRSKKTSYYRLEVARHYYFKSDNIEGEIFYIPYISLGYRY